MKNNFIRSVLLSFLPAMTAGVITGCRGQAAQPSAPPPNVTVAPVEQKEIVEWSEFTGRTEPVESVEVRPRVSGYIQEVRFQSGQLVKKGDVLFVIDPRWHQAVFDAAPGGSTMQAQSAKRIAPRNCWPTRPSPPRKADARKAALRGSEGRAAADSAASSISNTRRCARRLTAG